MSTRILLLLFIGCQVGMGQDIELDSISANPMPTLLELEVSITSYTHLERDAKLASFNNTKSKAWKALLPSIGLGYNAVGKPRPSISWSPLQILDRKEHQDKLINDRQSIVLSYEIILTDRLHKLQQLYHDYLLDKRILESRRSTLLIDEALYAITERKYQEHLIKPSEYLAAKRGVMQARADVLVMEMELRKLGNGVRYVGRW